MSRISALLVRTHTGFFNLLAQRINMMTHTNHIMLTLG